MQPPAVQTYDQAYGSLGNIYDPQTSLVNQQVAALPGEYAPQFSALDQAKVNAFKSIDNSANAKGMLFSGFSPDQQAQYVGTKYLPAVAGLKTQQQQRTFALQDQLNRINAARSTQAQGTIAEQGKALNQYYKDQADAAYKQAQLQISAQRSRGGGGGGGLTPNQQLAQQGKYKLDFKGNGQGLKFIGPNGATSAYGYAAGLAGGDPGGTYNVFKQALGRSDSSYDKNALAAANRLEGWGQDPGSIMSYLKDKYGQLF